MSGCLKLFLAGLGAVAFITIIIGLLIWQSVSWLMNAAEPVAAQVAPLKLSEGEQEDVLRIIQRVNAAKATGELVEEYLTPTVFNGVMEKTLETDRVKGKKDVPLWVRGSFAGTTDMQLQMTIPMEQTQPPPATPVPAQPANQPPTPPQKMYINTDVTFQLVVVDGAIEKAHIDSVILRGRQAPLLPRWVLSYFVDQLRTKTQQQRNAPNNRLAPVKLLRRDGDRLHVILDGKKLKEQEDRDQQQQKSAPAPAAPVEKSGNF
jgi:hypothetical protein